MHAMYVHQAEGVVAGLQQILDVRNHGIKEISARIDFLLLVAKRVTCEKMKHMKCCYSLIILVNKELLHFRELATYWLVQMPYLESVLLGEQIVRFWVCCARVESRHGSIFLVWKTRRFLIMRPAAHCEGVKSSRYEVGISNYAWNQTRMKGVV